MVVGRWRRLQRSGAPRCASRRSPSRVRYNYEKFGAEIFRPKYTHRASPISRYRHSRRAEVTVEGALTSTARTQREPRRCDHRTLAVLHILPAAAAPPPTSHTTSRRRAAASLPHARLLLRKRDALAGDEDAEEGDARDEDGALPLVFLEVGLRGRQSERESGRGSAGGSDTGRIKSGEWEEEPQSSSSSSCCRLENGFYSVAPHLEHEGRVVGVAAAAHARAHAARRDALRQLRERRAPAQRRE